MARLVIGQTEWILMSVKYKITVVQFHLQDVNWTTNQQPGVTTAVLYRPFVRWRNGVGTVVMQYLKMPGVEPPVQWACLQWRVHSGHRSRSHKGLQTPSPQTPPGPWLLQCLGILPQKEKTITITQHIHGRKKESLTQIQKYKSQYKWEMFRFDFLRDDQTRR